MSEVDNVINVQVMDNQAVIVNQDNDLITLNVVEHSITISNLYSGVSPVSVSDELAIYTVGEDIIAFKAVAVVSGIAVNADSNNVAHIWQVRGVAINSVVAPGLVQVKTMGELSNGTWNWNMNQGIWFTNTGALTQVKPTTGFAQVIAQPISPTKLFVNLSHPVRIQ